MTEELAAKIDAFAQTLDPEEQAMLAYLFAGGDEVSGFGMGSATSRFVGNTWPGVSNLIAFGSETTTLHQQPDGMVSFGSEGTTLHQQQ